MNPLNGKISQKDIARIIMFSVVVDLVEVPLMAIPIVGWGLIAVIDFVAWLTFFIWFKRLGVNFNNFKRFMFFNSGLILDLIPFINVFAWTIDVGLVIWSVNTESTSEPAKTKIHEG